MAKINRTIFPYGEHELYAEHSLTVQKPKVVAFVLHGLNNPPNAMRDIIKYLNSINIYTINGSFKGHHGETPMEEMKTITIDEWRKEVYSFYLLARKKADQLKVPLIFVGYSTGPLIVNHLLNYSIKEPMKIDQQILFAPALALRVGTVMREFLTRVSGRIVVPSFYHHEFRKHSGSTVAAYKAIFKMIRTLRKTKFKYGNIPTLIFIDSKDELIPHTKLTKIMVKFRLDKWKLIKIDNQHAYMKGADKIHHLIITESLVGPNRWEMIKENIRHLVEGN